LSHLSKVKHTGVKNYSFRIKYKFFRNAGWFLIGFFVGFVFFSPPPVLVAIDPDFQAVAVAVAVAVLLVVSAQLLRVAQLPIPQHGVNRLRLLLYVHPRRQMLWQLVKRITRLDVLVLRLESPRQLNKRFAHE
jgi:hypothetical protein